MSGLSDWLGWLSIGSWLGAQFPQVIENYKRQSVDGLALPFLANWLFGDITNLIGCILTHQLPFQTYLATYFVFVDFSLLAQYFYYASINPSPNSRQIERDVSRSHEREASHYRTLSVVAAHVAASAALAAQHEQARSRRNTVEHSQSTYRHLTAPSEGTVLAGEAVEGEEPSEEALATLADSFHSDQTGRVRRKFVSWSDDRYASIGHAGPSRGVGSHHQHAPLSPIASPEGFDYESAIAAAARGRSMSRTRAEGEGEESVAQRRTSRAGKRGSTLVFLGAWALFGVGTMTMNKRGTMLRAGSSGNHVGRVLGEEHASAILISLSGLAVPAPSETHNATTVMVPSSLHATSLDSEPPSMERLIGRISAWMCTTLYLTSRLPQIWKNFVRKSVDGLSIALFVFAFLGNSFYVGSILTSPKMYGTPEEAISFLKESLPYLLGSGGTLVFDVTIVCQSLLYRMRPALRPRGRRRMSVSQSAHEEETGLLDAEQGDGSMRV